MLAGVVICLELALLPVRCQSRSARRLRPSLEIRQPQPPGLGCCEIASLSEHEKS